MKQYFSIALVIALFSSLVNASDSPLEKKQEIVSFSETHRSLIDSPISLQAKSDIYTTRDSENKDIDGLKREDSLEFKMDLTENDTISAKVKGEFVKSETTEVKTYLKYVRSNLLTEKENGVGLKLEGQLSHYPRTIDQELRGLNAKAKINSVWSKNLQKDLNLKAEIAYEHGIRNSQEKDDALISKKNQYLMSEASAWLMLDYNVTDRFVAGVDSLLEYKIYQTNTIGNTSGLKSIPLKAKLSYEFSNMFSAELYAEIKPFEVLADTASTSLEYVDNFHNQATYGLKMTLTAF